MPKSPADKKSNQKSATVRNDRRLRPSKGNPTRGGKVFGNPYKKFKGK